MLGVSIFLGKMQSEEQFQYLQKMKEAGFSKVFTSLHIPEDDVSLYKEQLQTLGTQTSSLDMDLMADVSTHSMKHLGLSFENAEEILSWGITGLRIDYGIEPEVIAKLSKKLHISLNASTLDEKFVEVLKENGLYVKHVEVWHNYYPRPETGLDKENFIQKNKWLRSLGFTVAAFVSGDGKRRGPLEKGLPTLEKHRDENPFAAYLELVKECEVDTVLIGDINIQENTLLQFKTYQNGIYLLHADSYPAYKEVKEIANLIHVQRMDVARDVIRSENSRVFTAEKGIEIESRELQGYRGIGTITIDNKEYGRYQGELQIMKRNLDKSHLVNIIGSVVDKDIPILSYIGPGESFQFVFRPW